MFVAHWLKAIDGRKRRMKTKPRSKADPIERQIESAFRPGTFIRDGECFSFVSGLEEVAAAIDTLVATEPVRAVALYETFLAGCHAKADELDDSSGSFGQFARDLICKWIKSRPATGADPHKTVTTLLVWMEDGPFAFCYRIEKDTAAAFDKAGLAAFEKQIRERFDAASVDPSSWTYRRTAEILREIYIAQEDIQAYIGLAEQTELKPEDCLVIAKVLVPWQPNQALGWVERGRALDREKQFRSAAAHDLDKLHRELLSKLGRADEALEGAWGDFRKHPSKFTYDDLMKFVPTTERTAWHEKALNAASGADLHWLLELFTEMKEMERLADLVRRSSDEALEKVSHFATDPAAKRLEKSHPGLAARLWRAQGMRIVNAKKSKYYNAALLKFRAGPRLLSAGGTGDRMGANCALGLGIALPQDRLHQWISGVGCRLKTQRTTSVLRAREDAMGRAAREKCLLRTPKQHDPVSPGEIGRNEPTTL
jgi:hypothetical protein